MRSNTWLLVVGIILSGFIMWYFSTIFIYIIIAAVLALIGQPIDRFYAKYLKIGRFKLNSTFSALLTFLTLLSGIFFLIKIFVPLVMEEIRIFSSLDRSTILVSLQKPINVLENILRNFNIDFESINLQLYLQEKLMSVFTIANISVFFNRLLGAIGDFFIAVFSIGFLTFFFLRDEDLIIRTILSVLPQKYYERVRKIWTDSEQMLKHYFIGVLTEVLLVIAFIAIGLWIAGIKHAFLIALFAGLMNVIPYVGPIIGAVFGLFVGITTSPDMSIGSVIVKILIVFPVVNLADTFLLQPFIYSSSVKAHPVEIFLVIMAGATLGGIGGMILAVPAYTVLRVFAKEFIHEFQIIKNNEKQ